MNIMRKLCLATLILFSCNLYLSAQTAKDLEANNHVMKEVIADGDNNICAYGSGDTYDDAINDAKMKLANSIYSHVELQTTNTLLSKTINGDITEETTFTSDFKATTELDLQICHTLLIEMPGKKSNKYTVFAYIDTKKAEQLVAEQKQIEEKEELQKKEKLKNSVNFYYDEGRRLLTKYSIGNALKQFYCGYIISMGTQATIERNSSVQPAAAVFTQLLEETLDSIQVICEYSNEEQIDKYQTSYIKHLGFYYGNPLRKLDGLDFKYNDGYTYVNGARVRDGKSIAELRIDMDQFNLYCVYEFNKNELDDEIKDAMEAKHIESLPIASAEKVVNTKIEKDILGVPTFAANIAEEPDPIQSLSVDYDTTRFDSLTYIMYDIENAIRNKKYDEVAPYFTENGLDCFDKLVRYGKASIIEVPTLYEFIPFEKSVICRSITMQFKFKNNKDFVEKVIFRFDEDNKIESLAFALTETAQHDIMDNEDWNRDSKITLLSFMEDYQTAYALRRIDYLEQIFSENALIISGYKVWKKMDGDEYRLRNYTSYDTLSKKQYMDKLRRHFNTKEYINLNFLETAFTQASGTEDFFGVRVRQEYWSSNYGDVGYLFLLVDLREDVPIIHVRAWQEDKLPLKQLFSLKNIMF